MRNLLTILAAAAAIGLAAPSFATEKPLIGQSGLTAAGFSAQEKKKQEKKADDDKDKKGTTGRGSWGGG